MLVVASTALVARSRLRFQKVLSSWNIAAFVFLAFADTATLLAATSDACQLAIALADSKSTEPIHGLLRRDIGIIRSNRDILQVRWRCWCCYLLWRCFYWLLMIDW